MPTEATNSPSKGALRIRNLAIVLLVLLPLSALGSRFGLWPFTVGLLLLAIAMLGSLLIQIITAIWLFRKPAAGTKTALRYASLFALPPLVLVAAFMRGDDATKAGIHNITTDYNNPPQFVAAVKQRGENSNPLAYTPEIAAIQKEFFPEVASLNSELTPAEAFARAVTTAETMGWVIYAQDETTGRIEAVETTFWFGFKDDIVIRINSAEGEEDGGTGETRSIIDLRSVSRVGRSDLGANAKRIMSFQTLFADSNK